MGDLIKLTWDFMRISKALTFQLGDEPEIVHFIRTGYVPDPKNDIEPTYHVVREDAYGTQPIDDVMTTSQIKEKFDIDIDIEFTNRLTEKTPKDGMVAKVKEALIENKEAGYYEIDMLEFLKSLDTEITHQTMLDVGSALSIISMIHGVPIMTATQKQE